MIIFLFIYIFVGDTTAIPPSLPQKGQFSSGDTIYSTDSTIGQNPSIIPSQMTNMNDTKGSESHQIFTASGISVRKSAPPQIYKWETTTGSDTRDSRTQIVIDNNGYLPSNHNSIYVKNDTDVVGDVVDVTQQPFIDIQVVLTKEELDTLAARRKKLLRIVTANPMNTSSINCSKMLQKNHIASMSMHASTPYVDAKRIQKELFIRR